MVVDASVALKWFIDEEGSAPARALVASGEPLFAPDLIVAETCNAAWKLFRRSSIGADQYRRIASEIARPFSRWLPLDQLAPRAAVIAQLLDHPIYDCFYIAVAELIPDRLVTADSRFLRRLAGTEWEELATALYRADPIG
jgi:predicted nucleic acid-binding protein